MSVKYENDMENCSNYKWIDDVNTIIQRVINDDVVDEETRDDLTTLAARLDSFGINVSDRLFLLYSMARDIRMYDYMDESMYLFLLCSKIAFEMLGDNHPSTKRYISRMLSEYEKRGGLDNAESFKTMMENIVCNLFGSNHPRFFTIQENYSYSKDKSIPLGLYERCHKVIKEMASESKMELLENLKKQASEYYKNGDYHRCLEFQKRHYIKSKEFLGEHDFVTLNSLNSLVLAYHNVGDLEKTLELQKLCYDKSLALFGKNSNKTLTALNNLSHAYDSMGNHVKAIECQKEFYEEDLKTDRILNIRTLRGLLSFVCFLLYKEQYEDASIYAKTCCENMKRAMGESALDTIDALHVYAYSLSHSGRLPEAIALYRECYEKRKEKQGENHPETLTALNNLAVALYRNNEFDEALPLQRMAYEKRREILGESHRDTEYSRKKLTILLRAMGEDDEAENLENAD